MFRFVRFLRRAAGRSAADFDAYRRDRLGPMVAGLQLELALVRYVQTHRWPGSPELESGFLALRPGAGNDVCGVEEFWWRDEASCLAALTGTAGPFARILQDQEEWVDSAVGWCAIDYPQVATQARQPVAAPKSGLVKLVFAISPQIGLEEAEARRIWLVEHGPLIRSLAPARGTIAYNQVHRQRETLETRMIDAGLMHQSAYMGHAEAWFGDGGAPLGADGKAAVTAAITDERRFIDWSRSFVLTGKELVFVDRNWD